MTDDHNENFFLNTMVLMTCTCGFESTEGVSFCASCGKDFRVTAPEPLELDESSPVKRTPSRASLREVKREAKARQKIQKRGNRPKSKSWISSTEIKFAIAITSITIITFIIYIVSSTARPTIGSFVSDGFNGLGIMAKDLATGLAWVSNQINSLLHFFKELL
jgi:hypothetical protein